MHNITETYPQIDDRLGLIKACKEAMVIAKHDILYYAGPQIMRHGIYELIKNAHSLA